MTGPSEDSDSEESKDPPKGDIHVADAETYSTDFAEIQGAASAETSIPTAPLALNDEHGLRTLDKNATVQQQTCLLGEPSVMAKGCTPGLTRLHNVSSRLKRKQLHNRSYVYQPPTAPIFLANSTAGDVSILFP